MQFNINPQFRKKILKISRITAFSLLGLILLAGILLFAFRGSILRSVLGKVQDKLRKQYQTEFTYSSAGFSGFSEIYITDIKLRQDKKPELLSLDSSMVDLRFWSLLKGKIRISSLLLGTGKISLIKDSNGTNFSAFLKSEGKPASKKSKKKKSYANTAYELLRAVLEQIPSDLSIRNFSIEAREFNRSFTMALKDAGLKNDSLDAHISISDSLQRQEWRANGFFDSDDMRTDVALHSVNGKTMYLPYLKRRFGLSMGCDSIRIQLYDVDFGEELKIKGEAYTRNFLVNHKRISDQDVAFDRMGLKYDLKVDERSITLDSTSTVTLNRISFNPFFTYAERDSSQYGLFIHTPEWSANDFFQSLPSGIFNNLDGFEADGSLSFHLDFFADYARLDELVFNSELRRNKFRIKKYGKANLAKMNGSFVHTPYEYGKPMRSIVVGPENPNFVPLEQIPDNLKNCVLINEDPSFFHHRGFIEEAFRQSIIENMRSKRFVRGGSTISMQLVKNVFLSRQKTVARKMEEALIVWLIESNRITSKERMFEVYLNIIEWAPNIYGIGEASRFYFDKSPSQLSLNECMFLAKLIPSPKAFRYRFDKRGELKEYFGPAFKFMAQRLVARGWLSAEDTMGLEPRIKLKGVAKNYIVISDSTVREPDLDEEDDEDDKKWWQKIDVFDIFKKKKKDDD